MKLTLIATTAMGLESVLKEELKALGYTDLKVADGKVEFEGDLTDVCKTNLWLRTAGRIYIKVASFKAITFDELFDKTQALNWESWIGPDDKFPVSKITSRKSKLFSKSDGQRIVKKAIVSRLKRAHRAENLPEKKATIAVRVQIEKDIVTLSIDTSGEGLNKRGYRAHYDRAPLRETLAAGLLLLNRWNPEKETLIDPFCGTGTILIEAGLIAKNMAPGLYRSFAAEEWHIFPKKIWANAHLEAKDQINHDAQYRIYGSDTNGKALNIARKNIELAHLDNIFVEKKDVKDIQSRFRTGKIITNPPYGERLDERKDVEKLYEELGKTLRANLPDWKYYILTSHEHFEFHFGQNAKRHRKLYNGGIKCFYYQYF